MSLHLFNGMNVVFIDTNRLAVKLLELVEAAVIIKLRLFGGFKLGAIF